MIVDASPTGPAGELGVLPGRQELVVLARELGELLDDDRARRHVYPERQRLRCEHDLHQTFDEARLDRLLEATRPVERLVDNIILKYITSGGR